MAGNIVDLNFAAVAQSTSVKTTVGAQPSAHVALKWLESCVSFNSGTSTDTPGKVELGMCTFATNPPGTNSTAITTGKRDTAADTFQFLAASAWSTEPTVITVLRTLYDPQYNGLYHYINPLSAPYILRGSSSTPAGGGVIRITAGNGTPAASGHMTVEE